MLRLATSRPGPAGSQGRCEEDFQIAQVGHKIVIQVFGIADHSDKAGNAVLDQKLRFGLGRDAADDRDVRRPRGFQNRFGNLRSEFGHVDHRGFPAIIAATWARACSGVLGAKNFRAFVEVERRGNEELAGAVDFVGVGRDRHRRKAFRQRESVRRK